LQEVLVSLSDWLQSRWVSSHRTSAREIADLLAVVERDLADSAAGNLSPDWKLNIAYNAALQAATAALAAAGFRASRDRHHYRVIQSLGLTIRAPSALVTRLDAFRRKRNIDAYERAGVVSDGEAVEMRELARTVRDDVVKWLKSNHPDLLVPSGGPTNR
jgi:hypothetical protein